MRYSLKSLEDLAAYATTANDQRRQTLVTLLNTNPTLTPEVHEILSSLYGRLGNDSMVINRLLDALKDISIHAQEFPLDK